MSGKTFERYRSMALRYYRLAHIVLTEEERDAIEITDFGLGNFETIGLSIVVYIHTDRYSAEEMVLLPGQTCPEHRHPPVKDPFGKEETFRCRYGEVYLYLPGEPVNRRRMKAAIPRGKEGVFQVLREVILRPGEQYTIPPNTPHWFQAGREGAVVSEFSSCACDAADIFLDPAVVRTASLRGQ